MTLASDLRNARALIDTPEKWRKFTYDGAERMCAVGACVWAVSPTAAARNDWPFTDAETALMRHLPPGFASVPIYNDHPDTTHADVMALFDRAIAAAESPEATNG